MIMVVHYLIFSIILVFLSFGLNTLHCHYQGIASARPVMQINGHSFAGQYEDMLGTCLLMEKKNQDAQGSNGNHVSLTVTMTVWKLVKMAHGSTMIKTVQL